MIKQKACFVFFVEPYLLFIKLSTMKVLGEDKKLRWMTFEIQIEFKYLKF